MVHEALAALQKLQSQLTNSTILTLHSFLSSRISIRFRELLNDELVLLSVYLDPRCKSLLKMTKEDAELIINKYFPAFIPIANEKPTQPVIITVQNRKVG